jgi:hypothetical protein
MSASRIPVLALKACLVVALAAAASACVLVESSGAKGGRDGGDVVLCHKGKKTMTLPREAAGAHLEHGDHYGAC